jgi:hypothetical protein
MSVRRLITCLGYAAIGTLALTGVGPASALGAGDQAHMEHATAQKPATGLLKIVRESTRRFRTRQWRKRRGEAWRNSSNGTPARSMVGAGR